MENKIEHVKATIQKLSDDLKKDDWMVRENAIDKLCRINSYLVIEPLILALSDRDLDIRAKAEKVLTAVTNENFGQDSTQWQVWWSQNSYLPNQMETKSTEELRKIWHENLTEQPLFAQKVIKPRNCNLKSHTYKMKHIKVFKGLG